MSKYITRGYKIGMAIWVFCEVMWFILLVTNQPREAKVIVLLIAMAGATYALLSQLVMAINRRR